MLDLAMKCLYHGVNSTRNTKHGRLKKHEILKNSSFRYIQTRIRNNIVTPADDSKGKIFRFGFKSCDTHLYFNTLGSLYFPQFSEYKTGYKITNSVG